MILAIQLKSPIPPLVKGGEGGDFPFRKGGIPKNPPFVKGDLGRFFRYPHRWKLFDDAISKKRMHNA